MYTICDLSPDVVEACFHKGIIYLQIKIYHINKNKK